MNTAPQVDAILRALADPTRRSLFDKVAASTEISVSDLTRGSGVSQGAVSQHLKSLRSAGLVLDRAQGRNVYYRASPDGLQPLFDWITHYEIFWRDRLADLRTVLRETDP